ncbi:MAG: T9SS type A sorting domain-containing protein [Flavobacteriales bacterium]|nr:T9SS type A sorting domain-containing protein [Flavobacteriales bacterium]
MSTPFPLSRFRSQIAAILGLVLSIPALAQPTVQIGIFPSAVSGQLDVRLKANGDFDQLLSNLLFTISWPTASGIGLDNAQLVNLCDRLPIVPNGDGVQQSGGRSYQTYFMLSLQSLAGGCPLLSGQELTVMRVPVTGLSACTDISIANDSFTANNNKNYYISLNGQDRTGTVYTPSASLCSCSILTLSITTDNQPAQTGWAIYSDLGAVLYSGTLKPGQTSRTVALNSCEPNGCYRVRITDAGGNGIAGGGYTVKLGNDRIIDATGAFGSASGLKNNGTFCIPLGPVSLKPTSADLAGIAANTVLTANKITGANSYTFWIFDPHGSFDTTVVRNTPKLKLIPDLWNRIPHDLSLNVRVNARTGGAYGPFGKACTAMLGSAQLRAIAEVTSDGDENLTVYPNPLQDNTLHVHYTALQNEMKTDAVIELMSTTGQLVLREETSFTGTLDQAVQLPAGTASGIYVLIFTTEGQRSIRRVVQP